MKNTEKVKLAVIGLGSRGGWLVDQFLTMDNVFISALSDVYEDRVESCAARVEKACGEIFAQFVEQFGGAVHRWFMVMERAFYNNIV